MGSARTAPNPKFEENLKTATEMPVVTGHVGESPEEVQVLKRHWLYWSSDKTQSM